MDFFVMLYTQDGGYTPLMQDDDNIAKFSSLFDASQAASTNTLGCKFGFEVFEIGCGYRH